GVGFAKNAGNYGASLYPTTNARLQGYDQVLWTDAFEHKYLQEVGTMNVFFIIDNKAVTPSLEDGTILAGITRDSSKTILQKMGLEVEERKISIDELIEAHKSGLLKEVFGTGTAASISFIRELKYKDYVMHFNVDEWKVSPELRDRLNNIRYGVAEDEFGWIYEI
ncbi:MAG: aminotransferase class IV, partial [Chitinophagales bacterium]|nr:aminotransferase class IV [Chitinophagales bacterium]